MELYSARKIWKDEQNIRKWGYWKQKKAGIEEKNSGLKNTKKIIVYKVTEIAIASKNWYEKTGRNSQKARCI